MVTWVVRASSETDRVTVGFFVLTRLWKEEEEMKKILVLVFALTLAVALFAPAMADPPPPLTGNISVDNIPTGGITGGGNNRFCSENEDEWDEWHFVINQLNPATEEAAPDSITAVFQTAGSVTINFDKLSGSVAHYRLEGLYLTDTLLSASAVLPEGVTAGNFNLSHAPCTTDNGGGPHETEVGGEIYPNNTSAVASIVGGSVILLAGAGILLRRRFFIK